MRQADLGNKRRYISDDGRGYPRNLRGPKEALKQASHEAMRINWIVVLARGRVAIEMLPEDWALNGDGMAHVVASLPGILRRSDGMAHVVASLPGILRRMLGPRSTLPRTLWTNRGTGMYSPLGMVVHAYAGAAASAGFRLYWEDNAKEQAPDIGDLLLHEVAVAWFRGEMRRTKPTVMPWEDARAQWAACASRCVTAINSEYNAKGLCAELLGRLRKFMEN